MEWPWLNSNTRAKHAVDNPVAYVAECKAVIFDVLSYLFCMSPESFYSAEDGKSSRKTRYYVVRGKGAIGHTLAIGGCVEDHAKGTLHFHFIVYGGLPPALLQRFSDVPVISDAISKCLNETYRARADTSTHVRHLIQSVLKEMGQTAGLTVQNLDMLKRPCILNAEPLSILDKGNLSHAKLEEATNYHCSCHAIHEHTFTCWKGLNGHTGCRLCRPFGTCQSTHPVLLVPVKEEMEPPLTEPALSQLALYRPIPAPTGEDNMFQPNLEYAMSDDNENENIVVDLGDNDNAIDDDDDDGNKKPAASRNQYPAPDQEQGKTIFLPVDPLTVEAVARPAVPEKILDTRAFYIPPDKVSLWDQEQHSWHQEQQPQDAKMTDMSAVIDVAFSNDGFNDSSTDDNVEMVDGVRQQIAGNIGEQQSNTRRTATAWVRRGGKKPRGSMNMMLLIP